MEITKKHKITDNKVSNTKISWLNLHKHIESKDVRKMIYGLLNKYDRFIVEKAHNTNKQMDVSIQLSFTKHCAKNGYLSLLQWCRTTREANNGSNFAPWDEMTCNSAAKNGHLEVLKWCRTTENGRDPAPWSSSTCANAARNGHLEVLQWLRKNGCRWDVWTCAEAANGGHLEVLQWARASGCPWDVWTCASAAKNGHLDILKWCRETRTARKAGYDEDMCGIAPWDKWTCYEAAQYGHLETLKWARENGCPWDKDILIFAKYGGPEIVEWINKNSTF